MQQNKTEKIPDKPIHIRCSNCGNEEVLATPISTKFTINAHLGDGSAPFTMIYCRQCGHFWAEDGTLLPPNKPDIRLPTGFEFGRELKRLRRLILEELAWFYGPLLRLLAYLLRRRK